MPNPGEISRDFVRHRIVTDHGFLDTAEKLYCVRESKGWATEGYPSWTAWLKARRFSLSRAQDLVRMHEQLVIKIGLPKKRLRFFPRSKLYALASLVLNGKADKGSIGEWLDRARHVSVPRLWIAVRAAIGEGAEPIAQKPVATEPPPVDRVFTARLTREERQDLELALTRAAPFADTTGAKLQFVSLVFLAGYVDQVDRLSWARWLLQRVSKSFKITIKATDQESGSSLI